MKEINSKSKENYDVQVLGGFDEKGMPYVKIRDKTFNTYLQFKNANEIAKVVFGSKVFGHPKDVNIELTKKFQCTPTKFLKLVNGVMFKTFIGSLIDKYGVKFVNKYCKTWYHGVGKIDYRCVWFAYKNKDIIDEVITDGLYNLVPFAVKGISPKKGKEIAGKVAWKKICKFSEHRNMLLAKYTDTFKEYSEIPSALLKYNFTYVYPETIKYITKHCKGIWCNKKEIIKISILHGDTTNMLHILGKTTNLNWSLRRLQEEHDKASREINKRNYSSDIYSWIGNTPTTISSDNYDAVLLDNNFAIAEEGTAMSHCVASYAQSAFEGNYVVYSIRDKNGERHSTLGLTRDKETGKVKFQQHYKKFNALVNSDEAVELANVVIKRINNAS